MGMNRVLTRYVFADFILQFGELVTKESVNTVEKRPLP